MKDRVQLAILVMLPALIALAIGLSSLSFVPVPWPDDSAFYFAAKDLLQWPPRWVMLPQAPFEPTYKIFNFNIMPLFSVLLGMGRWIGIDGSHALKFWPLAGMALCGSLLGAGLLRAGLPFVGALLVQLALMLDPGVRWASVLVRPESLIGALGMAAVLGLTFGWPERLRARGLWHPVSACLALAAYLHYNAIHLLFAVVPALALRPREMIAVGWRTALYLLPWVLTVLWHFKLFYYQMSLQWGRLTYRNPWLDNIDEALRGLYLDMGSPEGWPPMLKTGAALIWVLMLAAVGVLCVAAWRWARKQAPTAALWTLVPVSGWVVGACWLWKTKAEVWFTLYMHLAAWTFAGVAGLVLWRGLAGARQRWQWLVPTAGLAALVSYCVALFGVIDVAQAQRLSETRSWHWSTFEEWIDCIDAELMRVDARLGHPKPFRVWDPTFPDATIALSLRHPDWEFTRTCDFWDRAELALQHGRDVEAMVVTETVNPTEREISAPLAEHADVKSVWMTWDDHFLSRLERERDFKPTRYLCQRGRWQAFIYEK